MKRVLMRFFCCVFLLLTAINVQAQTFRVSDIRVEGLQRVSAGTVFSSLPIRVGDSVTQLDIQNATRELYKDGLFTDVEIKRDGDVLVLALKERPAISKIEFEGNKAIKTENLMDTLKKNNLTEGQIFQRVTLENITQALEHEYVAQGRYGASVIINIEDLPRNQVKVKIKVSEGAVARIKQINIVGNKAFVEQDLINMFELKTSTTWSWLTGNDKYSKEKMKGDLERLETYYLDRGYLAFKVESSQISLSPDKTKIFITVNVTEGDVYTVSDVELAGDPILPVEVLKALFLMSKDQIFSQILMTTTAEVLTQRLGNEGYTFAKVEGMPERNEADKTVKVTFFIDPGKRAYVNRIDFRGNTKTIDEVLRREMRQMEGGAASNGQIDNSKVHLERLGFFKEVKVESKEVPGTSDKVDVTYTVEEQPSGSMTLQIGYAQYSGLLFQAGIQQTNWFGTGKAIGFNFSKNKYQTGYSLNYEDPYFTPDGVSRGLSFYYQKSSYALSSSGITPYSTNTYGAKVNFGYPVSEIERMGFDFGLRNLEVIPTSYSSQEVIRSPRVVNGYYYDQTYGLINGYISQDDYLDSQVRAHYGKDFVLGTYPEHAINEDVLSPPGFLDKYGRIYNTAEVSTSWSKSTLNRGVLPDRGSAQRINAQITVPGSDLEYYKLDFDSQYYQPLTNSLTLHLRGHLGYADTYGVTDRLPFFENYYGGGFGSVRGFERNSLGPRSTNIRTPVAGYSGWDDLNGDGIQQSSELNIPVLILCKDSALGCTPGKLITSEVNLGYSKYLSSFGGNLIMEAGAEVLFKLPFIKDQRSLQTSFFLDAGNVFDTHCGAEQINCSNITTSQIKMSAGLGLTWISSFGPMQFSLAKPVSRKTKYDRPEIFQFSLGQTF